MNPVQTHNTLRKAHGMTIISLLVGMFLSLLCILASLTLYKNLVVVAADTKIDALHDGALAASMLTAQKEVLSAGFGIDNADADDIVVRSIAATGTTPGTIELLWRYTTNGTFFCRGLMETGETNTSNMTFRVLRIREVTSGCDETTALASMSWTDVDTLAKWRVVGALATYINTNHTLLEFTVANAPCSPFGSTDLENHVVVTVAAPGSAKLNGANGMTDTVYEFCLPNTYPAS